MKILVTGGAGFIGSNIANTLAERKDFEVVALDDQSLGDRDNLSSNVDFVKGSVLEYDLVRLSKGCDYIFHQAAKSSSPMFKNDPRIGVDVNVMGFMNVAEAAKKNNVKRLIYASSSSVYNGLPLPFNENQVLEPKTFYEVSFYCREAIARSYFLEYGLSSIGLRYFSVYGPNESHKKKFANNVSQFLWDIDNGKSPEIYGDGKQTRDLTYVDDIVQANILAMESDKKFGLYNVGTGVETSFNQIVELLNKHLGKTIKPAYLTNPIKNYVYRTLADISLAKRELGYVPKWTVDNGIKQLIKLNEKSKLACAQKA
jgi:UDP-glucose 4-epimerase